MAALAQSDTATGNYFLFYYLYSVGGVGLCHSTNA